mmetsp:Transcript_14154/g.26582  ORF Transcript_14154/g.26582 Transcript_14154/m.26582 type:complete len:81 (+) Transcript_14154:1988-2230(+)
MKVNEQKLLQARNTPLRSNEMSILLGEQGDFEQWEKILKKQVRLPSDVNPDLKLWYDYICNINKHSPSDFTWTTEEYIDS